MRILYVLFAVVLFLFQAAPDERYSAVGAAADTLACKATPGNFCRSGPCPPTFVASGSCHGGIMACCAK
uniref:Beta-defensin-like domain-containing protein n=1 Tax=Sphenodon punctatus TaxID=8508 RepID=A0A8D0HME8_SPHPU